MMKRGAVAAIIVATLMVGMGWARAQEPAEIKIGYLRQPEPKIALSLLQIPPDNDGVAGAQAAIDDNNTTGAFLKQRFSLDEVRLKPGEDAAAAALALADRGVGLILAAPLTAALPAGASFSTHGSELGPIVICFSMLALLLDEHARARDPERWERTPSRRRSTSWGSWPSSS